MVLEYSNLFFSILFAVEMLLKVVSDGPFGYIRDGFNVFDGFIVVLRSPLFRIFLFRPSRNTYGVGQKSKLSILSEYVIKTEKIEGV